MATSAGSDGIADAAAGAVNAHDAEFEKGKSYSFSKKQEFALIYQAMLAESGAPQVSVREFAKRAKISNSCAHKVRREIQTTGIVDPDSKKPVRKLGAGVFTLTEDDERLLLLLRAQDPTRTLQNYQDLLQEKAGKYVSTSTLDRWFRTVMPFKGYNTAKVGNVSDDKAVSLKQVAVIVQAEVAPHRMNEFLQIVKTHAVESRKEPGCVRFDVVRSQDQPNLFFFYKLYRNEEVVQHHYQQWHYLRWCAFQDSGGVIQSHSYKTDAQFMS